MNDPYQVLGVSPNASKSEIKKAYHQLAKKYHPDQYIGHPLEEEAKKKMQEINDAYDLIVSGKYQAQNFNGQGPFNQGNNGYNAQYDWQQYQQQQQARRNQQNSPFGYYGQGRQNNGRSCCDDLACLCLADTCCECMGGDCITCC